MMLSSARVHCSTHFATVLGLVACLLCQTSPADPLELGSESAPEEECVECRGEQLGTTITWYRETTDAAKLAREQDKLVFLIQVSGNFAREEFT
jgi:hypothetical protein